MFLQFYLLFLDEYILELFRVPHAFIELELILGDDVGIVADDGLDLQLLLHLVFLFFDLDLDEIALLFGLKPYHCHLLLQLLDLLLLQTED